MTEEPLGCSEALLCISNQCAIFSRFPCDGGQTLQLPAGRAEKMVIQSSSKPSSALISEPECSAPPLCFVSFTFGTFHESQLQNRIGWWDRFLYYHWSVGSFTTPASVRLLTNRSCRWDVCFLIFKKPNNIPDKCQQNSPPLLLSPAPRDCRLNIFSGKGANKYKTRLLLTPLQLGLWTQPGCSGLPA